MDRIFVQGLKVETTIGVHAWEQRIKQTLRLDLQLAADTRATAAGDDLTKTIDYAAVATRLRALATETPCRLVETLAERMAACVLEEFGVPWVRVVLTKEVALPGRTEVGVAIERGQLPATEA